MSHIKLGISDPQTGIYNPFKHAVARKSSSGPARRAATTSTTRPSIYISRVRILLRDGGGGHPNGYTYARVDESARVQYTRCSRNFRAILLRARSARWCARKRKSKAAIVISSCAPICTWRSQPTYRPFVNKFFYRAAFIYSFIEMIKYRIQNSI